MIANRFFDLLPQISPRECRHLTVRALGPKIRNSDALLVLYVMNYRLMLLINVAPPPLINIPPGVFIIRG